MITAHLDFDMERRARVMGAGAFLYKPFTIAQLRTEITRLLDEC
jgi:FixJ family two-component response regulator